MIKEITVDCSLDPNGMFTALDVNRKLLGKIVFATNMLHAESQIKPNYLICGYEVCAHLMDCSQFNISGVTPATGTLWKVGNLLSFEVYQDMYLEKNTILIKFDKAAERDFKLERILNDNDLVDTYKVTVDGLL